MSVLSKSRQQEWAAHIEACPKSGLTQKDYCQKHGLKQSQFWYWQSKLNRSSNPDVPADKHPPKKNRFIPVTIADPRPHPSDGLAMTFPGGIQLTGITPDNLAMVQRLVEVLK